MFMVTLRLDRAVGGTMNTEPVTEAYNLFQPVPFVLDMEDKLVGIGQSAEDTKQWVLGVYRTTLQNNVDGLSEEQIQECLDAVVDTDKSTR